MPSKLMKILVGLTLIAGVPSHAAIPHQLFILQNEYLPSGTISAQYTGSPAGTWDSGYGYAVRAGDTITFTNLDTVPHTVTSCIACWPFPKVSNLFDSGFLTFQKSWTLDTTGFSPGTYRYFCIHHTYLMRGSFVVLAS